MLNYLDRGTIASNGVNGAPGDASCKPDETCSHGSGIQYVKLFSIDDHTIFLMNICSPVPTIISSLRVVLGELDTGVSLIFGRSF